MPSEEHMQEVGVDRKRRFAPLVLRDGDLVLFGEGEKRIAGGELPFAPGRDDLDVGVQRIGRQLEAHLVVALARRAMGDRVGARFTGDLDQALGDERARDRRAQEILALVLRIGAEHRKDEVAHEFLAQVLDEDVLRLDAEQLSLLARRLKLLALAEIGGEGDDLGAVFRLQPFEDDGRVQAAGIGEDDALDLRLLGARHGGRDFLQGRGSSWPGFDPATHAAPLRKRVGTRPPRAPKVALSPLAQDRADGDAWMAGSSPAMTVEGRSAPATSTGLIRSREPHATGPTRASRPRARAWR